MAQFDVITNLHCLAKGLPHFQSFLYAQTIRLKQFYVNGNVNRMIVGTVLYLFAFFHSNELLLLCRLELY